MPGLLRPTREGVYGEAPSTIQEGACGLCKWCKLLVLKFIGLPRKPSYSVSLFHRIFLLSCPHTIILDISDEHINTHLGHLSFEYPGSAGAGPRQVVPEQGPQEAIHKELSRPEPRNQQAISMELSSDESCCSPGKYQAGDQAGITQLSWQLSSR